MKHKPLYNWIAEVARLLPGATFTPPQITYRDMRTRIRVVVNGKSEHFVVAGQKGETPDSPKDAENRFVKDIHPFKTHRSPYTTARVYGCDTCGVSRENHP